MKLINSRKIINKILDDHDVDFYDLQEEDCRCPCWEIKVDRSRGYLVFLVDFKEKYIYPLKKLKPSDLTLDGIISYMKIFKTQDLKALSKALKK
jgi:hypothetical protein